MIRQIIEPVAVKIKRESRNAEDTWNFLGVLYRAQEKISRNQPWDNFLAPNISALVSKSSYVQHTTAELLRAVPKNDLRALWREYQLMLDNIYRVLDPIPSALSLPTFTDRFLTNAGIIEHPVGEGYLTTLTASDDTVLATGLTTPELWADAWNTLLVPYEAGLGNKIDYITPLLGANSQYYYRKHSYLSA